MGLGVGGCGVHKCAIKCTRVASMLARVGCNDSKTFLSCEDTVDGSVRGSPPARVLYI